MSRAAVAAESSDRTVATCRVMRIDDLHGFLLRLFGCSRQHWYGDGPGRDSMALLVPTALQPSAAVVRAMDVAEVCHARALLQISIDMDECVIGQLGRVPARLMPSKARPHEREHRLVYRTARNGRSPDHEAGRIPQIDCSPAVMRSDAPTVHEDR